MRCPYCNAENDNSFEFCRNCGSRLIKRENYDNQNFSNQLNQNTVTYESSYETENLYPQNQYGNNDYQGGNDYNNYNNYNNDDKDDKKKTTAVIICSVVAVIIVLIAAIALMVHFTSGKDAPDESITSSVSDTTQAEDTIEKAEKTTKRKNATTKKKDEKVKEDKNLIPGMSSEQRSNVNMFISNFAETDLSPFNRYGDYSDEDIINFCLCHNYANKNGGIEVSDGTVVLDGSVVTKNAERFFGVDIMNQSTSLADYDDYSDEYWSSIDNMDYYSDTAHFTYGHYYSMAVVDSMVSNGDGTYDVSFKIYRKNDDEGALSKKYYKYTPKQAANSEYVYSVGKGKAVIENYKDGKYRLVSYEATKL